ncbi:MAG: FitA-like ribbon-helix-helix domain-containing protein [Actinomycetota bacterium]
MNKTLTIRGVTPELAERLEALARERGRSVNAAVLEILREVLGTNERAERLRRYATWSEEDIEEFEETLAQQRQVDDHLWR